MVPGITRHDATCKQPPGDWLLHMHECSTCRRLEGSGEMRFTQCKQEILRYRRRSQNTSVGPHWLFEFGAASESLSTSARRELPGLDDGKTVRSRSLTILLMKLCNRYCPNKGLVVPRSKLAIPIAKASTTLVVSKSHRSFPRVPTYQLLLYS